MSKATILKPGFLVVLKTVLRGGIQYSREDLTAKPVKGHEGAKVEKWKTTKIVEDPEEVERAEKARSKSGQAIRQLCRNTAFGLICPESAEEELDAAIRTAREICDEHNASANCTQVKVYVMKGRIASNDEEAARAIGSEIRQMLDDMNRAIDKMDPEAIRETAAKARAMETMLQPEQAERVSAAVEQARKAARQIVARVRKGGEKAADVVDDIPRGSINKARMMFLDFEESTKLPGQALPTVSRGRMDLDVAGTG